MDRAMLLIMVAGIPQTMIALGVVSHRRQPQALVPAVSKERATP